MSAPEQTRIVFQWAATIFAHNWPVTVWLALGLAAAARAYRHPSRAALSFLYGFAGLAFLFEYRKHLMAYLSEPVDFLLIGGLWPLNSAGHVLVDQVLPGVVLIASLILLLNGGLGWWHGRTGPETVSVVSSSAEMPKPPGKNRSIPWRWVIVTLGVGSFALWILRRRA